MIDRKCDALHAAFPRRLFQVFYIPPDVTGLRSPLGLESGTGFSQSWAVQELLQPLHIARSKCQTHNIIGGQPDSTCQVPTAELQGIVTPEGTTLERSSTFELTNLNLAFAITCQYCLKAIPTRISLAEYL
jgi:hypothetical protein